MMRAACPSYRRRTAPILHRLCIALLASALCGSLARAADDHTAQLTDPERALHVLNRLGYGPRPGDIEQVMQTGVKQYIAQQLHPEKIQMPEQLATSVAGMPALQLNEVQLFMQYGPPSAQAKDDDKDAKKAAQQEARRRVRQELIPQAQVGRLQLATQSPRQLQEVMTEFWFNHFNVFEGKQLDALWIGQYENQILRPNALGHFRTLLGAVAHSAAMLYYLDNWESSGASTPGAKGRFKGLNENYGRELLELHTMGVDSGYSQGDVITLARALTGWTMAPRRMADGGADVAFIFDAKRHDNSSKTLLGQPLRGYGEQEGEAALDLIARQPATAHFISVKLVGYFVSDKPDPALVTEVSNVYQRTDGDIRAMLQTIFESRQFWSRANYQTQFKTPYQFIVSSLRATETAVENPRPIAGALKELGQPLYGWLTPEGYKFTAEAWLNPDALLKRINFAEALASGRTKISQMQDSPNPGPAEKPALIDPDQLRRTLGPALSATTEQALADAPPKQQTGLMLGSPDFMKR